MKPLEALLNGEELRDPIEVIRHEINSTPRMGAGGVPYVEKKYSVHKGSQRIQAALKMGYTHIEGVIINDWNERTSFTRKFFYRRLVYAK